MYCIQCGTQNNETIRFCTRCGANLEVFRDALATPESNFPTSLTGAQYTKIILIAAMVIAIIGFLSITAIVITLATEPSHINPSDLGPIIGLTALGGFATIFLIVARLLRLISTAPGRVTKKEKRTIQPSAAPVAALPAQPQNFGVGSVVERTTAHLPQYAPMSSASKDTAER